MNGMIEYKISNMKMQSDMSETLAYISNREHDSILRRFRIRHTYIAHGDLLRGELAPGCIPCNEPLTAKHTSLDCINFTNERTNFPNVNILKDLFEKVTSKNINNSNTIHLVNKIYFNITLNFTSVFRYFAPIS